MDPNEAIDRWETFRQTDDRVKFEQHLDGLLALQKVQAVNNWRSEKDADWAELDRIMEDGLNGVHVLEWGADDA